MCVFKHVRYLGSSCSAISLLWYDSGESLKLKGGVVIPVQPPPGAEGVTSTAIMRAAHQWLGPAAIKGSRRVQCLS